MIVYSNTKREFINQCNADSDGHTIENAVANAMALQGLNSFEEAQRRAWRNSLPEVAKVLDRTRLEDDAIVAIEYKIRQANERLDFIITGKGEDNSRNILVIELKQWSTAEVSNKDSFVRVNVAHGHIEDHLHPSYQAKYYSNIIRNTYDIFQNFDIKIYSCSYLHNMNDQFSVLMKDNNRFTLLNESPCFLKNDANSLIAYIDSLFVYADSSLLVEMDSSRVVTSRQLADMLNNALHGNPFYSYDEGQATAVETIKASVRDYLHYDDSRVIIIKGGPGTGKSVVAVNVLGQLIKPSPGRRNGYNAFYCTANAAPRYLYVEELTHGDFTMAQLNHFFRSPVVFKSTGENAIDCCFFDEAHRLFYHDKMNTIDNVLEKAIKSTKISVFFIDEDQMVTRSDYTTIERIRSTSERLHKRVIEGPSLELKSQFRVLGGETYMSFIKSFLGYNNQNLRYRRDNNYDFKVFDSALDMYNAIKEKDDEERQIKSQETGKPIDSVSGTCRLVAGYCYEWKPRYGGSQGQFRDGATFDIILDNGAFKAKWNLRCSQVGDKYSWLNDPLSVTEVGCIHTCQGLDMKYCGVIIGKDLTYQNGLIFDKSKNAKSDDASGIRNANDDLAIKMIRNTYHVLLTRGMKGTYVYCEDEGLREYLKSLID